MDKESALDLIDRLGGDEQVWVDYKEDYYIQGNPYEEAEFRKDVQALANAETNEDHRYLLIGCNEEDGLVGVSDDATDDQAERRHILSFDADDLQEKLDGSLQPSPQISLHTYQENGNSFAVLVVEKVDRIPCVSTSTFGSNGDIFIREGDIWIRKSSGKRRADPDDVENLIQRRIIQQRDFILEGIRRVVAMDPETIAEIGSLRPNEAGEADITFEIGEEGDYTVSGDVFRREFSGLEEELDADIGKRRVNDQYFVDIQSLMRYYTQLSIPSDEEAARLLAESAMRQWLPGVYWLLGIDHDQRMSILRSVPDQNAVRHTACKTLVIAGDSDTFDQYIDQSDSIRHPRFSRTNYEGLLEETVDDRLSELYSIASPIDIGGDTVEAAEVAREVGLIKEYIPEVAQLWLESTSRKDLKTHKYSLVNLELKLAAEVL